jgi:IS30 family transposase
MDATIARVRKSEKLTAQEKKQLLKWVDEQPTKLDAAETIGIHRTTLDRVLAYGSGSPDNISKIRKVLA